MKLRRDGGSTELLLTLPAAMLLVGAAAVWGLLPPLREYLRLDDLRQRAVLKSAAMHQTYDRLYERKSLTENEYGALPERFESVPEAPEAAEWISGILPDANMTESGEGWRVTAPVASPAAFYRVLDRLSETPWALQADVPVRFGKAPDGTLTVTFGLRSAAGSRRTERGG